MALSTVPAARPSVHPAMRFLRGAAGRAYPRVVGSNRDKSWVAYDTILPLLGSVAFVYVYRLDRRLIEVGIRLQRPDDQAR